MAYLPSHEIFIVFWHICYALCWSVEVVSHLSTDSIIGRVLLFVFLGVSFLGVGGCLCVAMALAVYKSFFLSLPSYVRVEGLCRLTAVVTGYLPKMVRANTASSSILKEILLLYA